VIPVFYPVWSSIINALSVFSGLPEAETPLVTFEKQTLTNFLQDKDKYNRFK